MNDDLILEELIVALAKDDVANILRIIPKNDVSRLSPTQLAFDLIVTNRLTHTSFLKSRLFLLLKNEYNESKTLFTDFGLALLRIIAILSKEGVQLLEQSSISFFKDHNVLPSKAELYLNLCKRNYTKTISFSGTLPAKKSIYNFDSFSFEEAAEIFNNASIPTILNSEVKLLSVKKHKWYYETKLPILIRQCESMSNPINALIGLSRFPLSLFIYSSIKNTRFGPLLIFIINLRRRVFNSTEIEIPRNLNSQTSLQPVADALEFLANRSAKDKFSSDTIVWLFSQLFMHFKHKLDIVPVGLLSTFEELSDPSLNGNMEEYIFRSNDNITDRLSNSSLDLTLTFNSINKSHE